MPQTSEQRARRRGVVVGLYALSCGVSCGLDEREFSGETEECPVGAICAPVGVGPAGAAGAPAAGASGTLGLAGAGGLAGATAGAGGAGAASSEGPAQPLGNGVAGGAPISGTGGTAMAGAGAAAGAAGMTAAAGAAGGPAEPNGSGVDPACGVAQLLANGGFEAGSEPWVSFSTGQDPLIYDTTQASYDGVPAYAGSHLGWLGGVPGEVNRLSQTLTLPPNASEMSITGAVRVQVFEQFDVIDTLDIRLVSPSGRVSLFGRRSNDAGPDWLTFAGTANVEPYAGQVVTLEIESRIGDSPGTNFFLDALELVPLCTR